MKTGHYMLLQALSYIALNASLQAATNDAKDGTEHRVTVVGTANLGTDGRIGVRLQASTETITAEREACAAHGNVLAMAINKGDLQRANAAVKENGRVKLVNIGGTNEAPRVAKTANSLQTAERQASSAAGK